MDIALKLFQIVFYITASIIAVLTFIKAKNGLLNSVNTEYQKKVMERLSRLAEDIWEEFDFASEKHWAKNNALTEVLERVHNFAIENKHEILTGKMKFSDGVPVPTEVMEMHALLERLKSDPFIPRVIRRKLIEILDKRVHSTMEAYSTVIREYQHELGEGKHWDSFERSEIILYSKVIHIMRENGVGISELQEAAHEVRLAIQNYFESFNPIKN
jgi:hypothetical protein